MSDHEIESGNSLERLSVETPFQVVVRPQAGSLPRDVQEFSVGPVSSDRSQDDLHGLESAQLEKMEHIDDSETEMLSLEEIEAAYLQALEAAELAESIAVDELESAAERVSAENHASREQSPPEQSPPGQSIPGQSIPEPYTEAGPPPTSPPPTSLPQDHSPSVTVTVAELDESSSNNIPIVEVDEPILTAEQVIEAMLFVGGAPLPVKKFLDVLGGTYTPEQVETLLNTLNTRYLAQRRPYEIRLEEGGYRMQLISAYEGVRSRAYGHGPKEVKLAQDALELLAFIAYQQPISRAGLEETGKQNASALLRQLLRRELVCVDRSDETAGEVLRTTHRFLELFGLTSLEDLPQVGTFNFK